MELLWYSTNFGSTCGHPSRRRSGFHVLLMLVQPAVAATYTHASKYWRLDVRKRHTHMPHALLI